VPIGLGDLHRLVRMHQVRVGGSLLALVGVIAFIAADGVLSIAGVVVMVVALGAVAWAVIGIARQKRELLDPNQPVPDPATVDQLDTARTTIRQLTVAGYVGYGVLVLAYLTLT
jgi:hypothetical protein